MSKISKIGLIIILLLILVSCSVDYSKSPLVSSNTEMVSRIGSVEVWRMVDRVGAVVNVCYIVINVSSPNPDISCP